MKNKSVIIVLTLGVFFLVGGYFINKYFHKWVKSHPTAYCFETYVNNKVNSVLMLNDLTYKDDYIKMYKLLEKEGIHSPFSFNILLAPRSKPVYVIKYSDDGLLADIISYNCKDCKQKAAHKGGSYRRGWVYSKTLHVKPPTK